jgi:hypothetical protein
MVLRQESVPVGVDEFVSGEGQGLDEIGEGGGFR